MPRQFYQVQGTRFMFSDMLKRVVPWDPTPYLPWPAVKVPPTRWLDESLLPDGFLMEFTYRNWGNPEIRIGESR
jgi:hypothetical protein